MFKFLTKWLVNVLALIIVIHLAEGISSDSWQTTAVAALVLGFINAFLRPLIILLTLPLNILSLGLFTLVINGSMFFLVSKIVAGFSVAGFASAFWAALLFSLFSFILNLFVFSDNKIKFSFRNHSNYKNDKRSDIIDVEGQIDDNNDEGE
jgi:putative membrane protein